MVISGGAKLPTAESDLSSAEEPMVADERIPVVSDASDYELNHSNMIEENKVIAEQEPHDFQSVSDV